MISDLNHQLFQFVISLTGSPLIDSLMVFVADHSTYLIPPLLVLMWFLGGRERYLSVFAFLTVFVGQLYIEFIQAVYHQPRPYTMYETLVSQVTDNSFPSQHAATMFTFAFTLLAKQKEKLGYFFLMLAMLNGFSRMYIGVHFPLDILAGSLMFIPAYLTMKKLEGYSDKLTDLTTLVEEKVIGMTRMEKYYEFLKNYVRRITL